MVAVSPTTTRLPSSLSSTRPDTVRRAPLSSSGTGTGLLKRTPYSRTAPGSPAQSVTTRPASAMVNMPCAMTLGSPTAVAMRSFQWMMLKSPLAPAYMTRLSRWTGNDCSGSGVPTSTSAYDGMSAFLRRGSAAADHGAGRRRDLLAVGGGHLGHHRHE